MNFNQRLEVLLSLGNFIRGNIETDNFNQIFEQIYHKNNWFTAENVKKSLMHIADYYLEEQKLNQWLCKYNLQYSSEAKTVGLTMAGNIPLVGFHDLLCCFISGNIAQIKLSHKDKVLLPFLINLIAEKFPEIKKYIVFVERLNKFDAIIATGSNQTASYFEYYFGKYPHIIRKNRNAVAILDGTESPGNLKLLSDDIFTYFGLGCRNVAKLFLPEKYNFDGFFKAIQHWQWLDNHYRYSNNYYYYKSIFLVNQTPHFDNNFLLVKEDKQFSPPPAMLFFEYYSDVEELKNELLTINDQLQVVVGERKYFPDAVSWGQSQYPELWDYSDNIDTLDFLITLA